jgi:hypothetical protein
MANLPPSDPYTYFYSQIINNSTPSQRPQLESYVNSVVSPEEVLKDSKYMTYNSDIEEKQCPISLDEFKEGDSLIELPCKHIFLESSIKDWVKEKQTCPVCRHNLINVSSVNATYTHNEAEIERRQGRITHQIDTMIEYLTNQLSGTDTVDTADTANTLDSVFEIY